MCEGCTYLKDYGYINGESFKWCSNPDCEKYDSIVAYSANEFCEKNSMIVKKSMILDSLTLLAKEYISKVECCDECFCEMFCIDHKTKKGRCPYDGCELNIVDKLMSTYYANVFTEQV